VEILGRLDSDPNITKCSSLSSPTERKLHYFRRSLEMRCFEDIVTLAVEHKGSVDAYMHAIAETKPLTTSL